ncbi:MAG: ABC-2 transporter permease [Clostridiales bacterium]|nr:ABC-2 transporter permease [Clostridiales bacterium]
MKALVLKDIYMMLKYCRSFFMIIAVFTLISIFTENNLFFAMYPCLFVSLIPNSLLAYDERSKWEIYASTMPVTRAQMVSAKYIVGLMMQGITLIVSSIALVVRSLRFGESVIQSAALIGAMIPLMLLTTALGLPVMFRFGVEKGRIFYYVLVGLLAALAGGSSFFITGETGEILKNTAFAIMPALVLLPIVINALSWYLSCVFYKKREFN